MPGMFPKSDIIIAIPAQGDRSSAAEKRLLTRNIVQKLRAAGMRCTAFFPDGCADLHDD